MFTHFLVYQLDDGPLYKKGVLWYFGYVKEGGTWKREDSLAAMNDLTNPTKDNPLAVYFDKHFDELDKILQSLK